MLGEPDWERPLSKSDFDELTKRVRYTIILLLWSFVTTIYKANHLQIEEMAKYGLFFMTVMIYLAHKC